MDLNRETGIANLSYLKNTVRSVVVGRNDSSSMPHVVRYRNRAKVRPIKLIVYRSVKLTGTHLFNFGSVVNQRMPLPVPIYSTLFNATEINQRMPFNQSTRAI